MRPAAEAVRGSIWGCALDPKELARVESEMLERAVSAGGYVCRKGEPVNHWVGVIDGLVKLGTVSAEGKAATLAGVPSGGWFGEGSLLKSATSDVHAAARFQHLVQPLSARAAERAPRAIHRHARVQAPR